MPPITPTAPKIKAAAHDRDAGDRPGHRATPGGQAISAAFAAVVAQRRNSILDSAPSTANGNSHTGLSCPARPINNIIWISAQLDHNNPIRRKVILRRLDRDGSHRMRSNSDLANGDRSPYM
jgi:hypothetical protein